jgi:hypothetical protein
MMRRVHKSGKEGVLFLHAKSLFRNEGSTQKNMARDYQANAEAY